jgi:hypothetical protein
MYIQKYLLHSGNKQSPIMMKEITEEKDCDQSRHEFINTTSERGSFASRYQSFFYGYFFTCNKFRHNVVDFKVYRRNVQARDGYVALSNIECYKFHNYGHIARDCRSMIEPYMKENTNIRYKKVWRRK